MYRSLAKNLFRSIGLLVVPVFLFSGCVGMFGKTADMDMDVLVFPNDNTQVTVTIEKGDHVLTPGDTLALTNTTQPTTGMLGWPSPTCIFLSDYLGLGTTIIARAGYDTKAKTSSGTDKYPDTLIDVLKQLANYQLKMVKDGTSQEFIIPLQDGILLKNVNNYRIRTRSGMSGPITLAQALSSIKSAEDNVGDRTLCYTNGKIIKMEIAGPEIKDVAVNDAVTQEIENANTTPIDTNVPSNASKGPGAGPVAPAAKEEAPKSGCSMIASSLTASNYLSGASIWGLLFVLASLPLARKRR